MMEKEHSFLMHRRFGKSFLAEVDLLAAALACGVISLSQMTDALAVLKKEAQETEDE